MASAVWPVLDRIWQSGRVNPSETYTKICCRSSTKIWLEINEYVKPPKSRQSLASNWFFGICLLFSHGAPDPCHKNTHQHISRTRVATTLSLEWRDTQWKFQDISGWWFVPLYKNICQLGLFFPTEWEIKHVPNHQSVCCCIVWLVVVSTSLNSEIRIGFVYRQLWISGHSFPWMYQSKVCFSSNLPLEIHNLTSCTTDSV